MFGFFSNKKEILKIKEDTKSSFDSVKKDISAVSGWIKHLDSEKNFTQSEINLLKEEIASIKEEIEGIKNVFSVMNHIDSNRLFKKKQGLFNKQMSVLPVQTGVQTGVQTPNLSQFSATERAIIWVLLNSDLKLSYEDLSAILGKEKSTIRGQLNMIKQKNEEIIKEIIEQNGKKRVFIPENIKEKVLKNAKVRVKLLRKDEKTKE
jgi:hypothetical protein